MRSTFRPTTLTAFWTAALAFILTTSMHSQVPDKIRSQMTIADSSLIQTITLKNGDQLTGRIIEVREDEIDFQTQFGVMQIKMSAVEDIYTADASMMRDGKLWFKNPHTTRLFFSPTGRMLPEGDGYYQNIYLFFNGFAYGVTDNLTLGGGMSVFPTDDFLNNNVFYFTPKFGGQLTENFSAATGVLFIFLPFGEEFGGGIAYVVGTAGKPDYSFTFGLGIPFSEDNLAETQIILLGTDLRMTERISFVSENWLIPGAEDGVMLSYGLRFFGENIAIDLGFFNIAEDFRFPGWPYVDFVVKF